MYIYTYIYVYIYIYIYVCLTIAVHQHTHTCAGRERGGGAEIVPALCSIRTLPSILSMLCIPVGECLTLEYNTWLHTQITHKSQIPYCITLQHTATHCNTLQQLFVDALLRWALHINESRHTCECVMSHTLMSCVTHMDEWANMNELWQALKRVDIKCPSSASLLVSNIWMNMNELWQALERIRIKCPSSASLWQTWY